MKTIPFRLLCFVAIQIAIVGASFAQSPAGVLTHSLVGKGKQPALTSHQMALLAQATSASEPFLQIIRSHSSELGVDPALVEAVITVESRGDVHACSRSGAMGLMQLMPQTCTDFGVSEPYDPDQNIRGGAALLANHIKRYHGDLRKVLAAYNAGARYADNGKWIFRRQTRHYVPAVLAYYTALRQSGDNPVEAPETTAEKLSGGPQTAIAQVPASIPTESKYVDAMFQTLKQSISFVDTNSLIENGALDDVADSVLADYLAGRSDADSVRSRVSRELATRSVYPKTLEVFFFTTTEDTSFPDAWTKCGHVVGMTLGLAHGKRYDGHVWLIVATSR